MAAWGDRWLVGPEGTPLVLHHTACDHDMHAVVVCSECAEEIDVRESAGTARSRRSRRHHAELTESSREPENSVLHEQLARNAQGTGTLTNRRRPRADSHRTR